MKKMISFPKRLMRNLIVLLLLLGLAVVGVVLTVRSVNGSAAWLPIGILTLALVLPLAGLILFLLNRRVCWIWIENGCLKRSGFLWGFQESFCFEEIHSVGITYDNKKIFIVANSVSGNPHGARIIEFANRDSHMKFLRSFWRGDIKGVNYDAVQKDV